MPLSGRQVLRILFTGKYSFYLLELDWKHNSLFKLSIHTCIYSSIRLLAAKMTLVKDLIDAQDFEVIDAEGIYIEECQIDIESTEMKQQKAIHLLFEPHTKPNLIHLLAKVLIFAALPFYIFWKITIALIMALFHHQDSNEESLEQELLYRAAKAGEDSMNRCRKWLDWTDEHLGQLLEKYSNASMFSSIGWPS